MAVSGAGKSRRPGCLAWGLAIVAAIVVLCCVGAAGGGGVGWFASRPGEVVLPPEPAGFPAARYVPEAEAEPLADTLTYVGYECERGGDLYQLDCTPPESAGVRGRVAVQHDDAGIWLVTVVCSGGAETSGCGDLFAQAVDVVLANHPEEVRDEATDWARENAAVDAHTTVSDVELGMRRYDTQTELLLGAV